MKRPYRNSACIPHFFLTFQTFQTRSEALLRRSGLAVAASSACLRLGLKSTALFALAGERLAVAVVDAHETTAPPFVVVPSEGYLDRGARHPGLLEQV